MRYFYKNGFYTDDGYVPEDAIEITEERYHELLIEESRGYLITPDETGYPILIEQQPSPYHYLVHGHWHIDSEDIPKAKEMQQEYIWQKIKQRRAQANQNGVFVSTVNKRFQTTEEAKQKYDRFSSYIDKAGPIQWKCIDSSYIDLDKSLLDDIQIGIIQMENHNQQNAERHRQAMLLLDDSIQYDFSTGWSDSDIPEQEEV